MERHNIWIHAFVFVFALVLFFYGPLALQPDGTEKRILKTVLVICYAYAMFVGIGWPLLKRILRAQMPARK